jgi:hypothetical protein
MLWLSLDGNFRLARKKKKKLEGYGTIGNSRFFIPDNEVKSFIQNSTNKKNQVILKSNLTFRTLTAVILELCQEDRTLKSH